MKKNFELELYRALLKSLLIRNLITENEFNKILDSIVKDNINKTSA